MKLGVISDVHGNRVALEAVLADMPPVDELVCCGDIVGYNPWSAECIDRVRDKVSTSVIGNHGRSLLNGYDDYQENSEMAYEGLAHADLMVSDDQRSWLASLPEIQTVADGRVRMVHSHPDPEVRWTWRGYISKGEFTAMSKHFKGYDALLFGHTHKQDWLDLGRFSSHGLVVNPGSVGQPRDGDPRAAYSVVDLDAMTVEERRVEYDIPAVQTAIATAGLPVKTGTRLSQGR